MKEREKRREEQADWGERPFSNRVLQKRIAEGENTIRNISGVSLSFVGLA